MTTVVRAGRRKIEISRPDKALFPGGINKADLAHYYEAIADAMLPHVAGRPLNLERYPDGIEGQRIIQQKASEHFPDWIRRVRVTKEGGGAVEHVEATDAASLVYLANQACITLHPWASRSDRLDRPDRVIVDLDPSDGRPADVRQAARRLGELLRELGLEPFAMATGSRGYHVVAPLQRRQDFDEVRAFARTLADEFEKRDPRRLTTEQRKVKRGGRILVDVMRNAYAHTAVGAYSVRARPKAPVATPLAWDELSDSATRPDRWNMRTLPRRVERDGDPWSDISSAARPLGPAQRALEELRDAE